MLASSRTTQTLVQWTSPWVWRSNRSIARKLLGFAHTEWGSYLDMLKAAELCDDRKLRRLFFRHALEEARHANAFKTAARRVAPWLKHRKTAHDLATSKRQDLYLSLGLTRFVTFVHVSERRGAAHFTTLARRFRRKPELARLFRDIAKDEDFHVSYSGALLDAWARHGKARELQRARRSVLWTGRWQAWRRTGRQLGDIVSVTLLVGIFATLLWPFSLAQRLSSQRLKGGRTGSRRLPETFDEMRREW